MLVQKRFRRVMSTVFEAEIQAAMKTDLSDRMLL